ncbi:MAG: hypothetical protein ACERKN_12155 [Velocimicrobium sp.]
MSNTDMSQTVTFRLNLNHEEDSLVWGLLLSMEEEPRKGLFGDRSKFIKWVLTKYAREELDFDDEKKRLELLRRDFVQSAQYEIKEIVKRESESIMESLEKAVELAVSKAVNEVLKALVAGGISVGTQAVVTSAELKSAVIPKEAVVPKMGVLPEVDGDNELPTSALSFLDSF